MIQLDYKMEEIFIDIESFLYFLKSSSLSAIFQTYYSDLQKVFSSVNKREALIQKYLLEKRINFCSIIQYTFSAKSTKLFGLEIKFR